jgi:hypothetical protein
MSGEQLKLACFAKFLQQRVFVDGKKTVSQSTINYILFKLFVIENFVLVYWQTNCSLFKIL